MVSRSLPLSNTRSIGDSAAIIWSGSEKPTAMEGGAIRASSCFALLADWPLLFAGHRTWKLRPELCWSFLLFRRPHATACDRAKRFVVRSFEFFIGIKRNSAPEKSRLINGVMPAPLKPCPTCIELVVCRHRNRTVFVD